MGDRAGSCNVSSEGIVLISIISPKTLIKTSKALLIVLVIMYMDKFYGVVEEENLNGGKRNVWTPGEVVRQ